MRYACLTVLSVLALSGCASNTVRDTLGLDRSSPDEFRVVSRPPLSVPPQFSLRPPASSDALPNQLPADKKAQSIINGREGDDSSEDTHSETLSSSRQGMRSTHSRTRNTSDRSSGADSEFLKRAGADNADPTVREQLVEEHYVAQQKKEDKAWWDVWSGDEKKDPIVDSKKEAARIKKVEDEGKPITEGATPNVKPSDQGLLDSIIH